MSKKASMLGNVIFFVFIFSLSLLEISAYIFGEMASRIALYVWIIMGIYYLVKSIHLVVITISEDIRGKKFLGILAIFFVAFLFFYNTGFTSSINHESTQQAVGALENIKLPDFGYTKTAFLGYPSRQYLLTTIPTFIFGKYPWTLNLGYIYPVIFGILVFYSGIQKLFHSHPHKNEIASLAIFFIFLCNYTLPFTLHFEQSIIPLALTLQAAAWIIVTIKNPTKYNLIALIWIGTMLATTYTPGLASWYFIIAALMYLVSKKIKAKKYSQAANWLAVVIPIVVFGLLSTYLIITSTENKSFAPGYVDFESLKNIYLEGLFIFLSLDPARSFFHPIIFLPIWAYITSSIIGLNGIKNTVIAMWVGAVVSASVLMHGYANPPPDLSIHRSMVILPILCTALFVWFDEHKLLQNKKVLLFMYFSAMLYIPHIGSRNLYMLNKSDPRTGIVKEVIISRDIATKNSQKQAKNMQIIVNSTNDAVYSLNDMLPYFLDGIKYNLKFEKECSLPSNIKEKIIFFTDSEYCADYIFNTHSSDYPSIEKSLFTLPSQLSSWHKLVVN